MISKHVICYRTYSWDFTVQSCRRSRAFVKNMCTLFWPCENFEVAQGDCNAFVLSSPPPWPLFLIYGCSVVFDFPQCMMHWTTTVDFVHWLGARQSCCYERTGGRTKSVCLPAFSPVCCAVFWIMKEKSLGGDDYSVVLLRVSSLKWVGFCFSL